MKTIPPEKSIEKANETLITMRGVIKNDYLIDPDGLVLGEAFPMDVYSYDENVQSRCFSERSAWYFPVLNKDFKPVLGIFVLPNGENEYRATLGGCFDSIMEAAELLKSLTKDAGGSTVRGMINHDTYAVHSLVGEDERLVVIGNGIDKQYFEVGDYRQLPTLRDFEKLCMEREEYLKEANEDLWGGTVITLLPDLTKTFEPKIPTFVLPAALGVLACAAVAGAVYSVKKQKKKAG